MPDRADICAFMNSRTNIIGLFRFSWYLGLLKCSRIIDQVTRDLVCIFDRDWRLSLFVSYPADDFYTNKILLCVRSPQLNIENIFFR